MRSSKIAVVTGGSRGIGHAVCQKFASHGISVAALSRTHHIVEATSKLPVISEGQINLGIKCDVTDFIQISEALKQIENRIGNNIEILVNCAGITRDSLLITSKDSDINEMIQTNLVGSILMSKAVLKNMLRGKTGHIINIGSIVGTEGHKGQTVYSATKAGLVGFTKSLAKEVGSKGICVNLIAPGFIQTDMTQKLSEAQKQDILSRITLGKFGTVEDVAETAWFLANSKYITGQVVTVDGGTSL